MGSNPTLSANRARGAVLLVVLLMAALLAGCSLLRRPPYVFDITLPAQGELAALPLRLFDHSGTITRVELVPANAPFMPFGNANTGVGGVLGRSNAIQVGWLGGMCDEQVQLEYTGGDTTFTVMTMRREGGCRLAGITRALIVVFSSPVDVSRVVIEDVS